MRRSKPLASEPMLPLVAAAERIGVGRGVILRRCQRGEIGYVRVGKQYMIPESDLETFLANNYNPPR